MFGDMNLNSLYAAGKHVVSFTSGAVTLAVGWHFLAPVDAASINENLGHVVNGFNELAKGLAGLTATGLAVYSGWRAAHNASPAGQSASLVMAVPGTQIVTTQALAASVPSSAVMSQNDVRVVSKDKEMKS